MKDFASNQKHRCDMIKALVKVMRTEISEACGRSSKFTKDIERIKHFTWEMFVSDVEQKLPTLYLLLKQLIKGDSQPLLAMISAMILKSHNKDMCLLQALLSIHCKQKAILLSKRIAPAPKRQYANVSVLLSPDVRAR
jgi:hypothetical protein